MTAISFQSPYTPQPIPPAPGGGASMGTGVGPDSLRPVTPPQSGGFHGQSGSASDQSGAGAGNGTGTGGVLQYLARLTLSQPTPKSLFEARALTDLGLPKVEMPYPLPTAPIFLTSER